MTKEQEALLAVRAKRGDIAARKELIDSLAPLIVSQASRFYGSGLPNSAVLNNAKDLASQAIDTYDPSRGTQLNTHVVNYLKKISRFTTEYQNVGHIPENRALVIGSYNTTYANLAADKGREPLVHEIADEMSLPLIEVERLQTELRKDLSSSIISDGDEAGGFFEYIDPTVDTTKRKFAIEAVWYDSTNLDREILGRTIGGLIGGRTYIRSKSKDIAIALNLTDSEVKKRKLKLAQEINSIL